MLQGDYRLLKINRRWTHRRFAFAKKFRFFNVNFKIFAECSLSKAWSVTKTFELFISQKAIGNIP